MTSEFEPTPHFEIDEMKLEEIDDATLMRKNSWIDTHTNSEKVVTAEWIEQRFVSLLSEKNLPARQERFLRNKKLGTLNAWVARDEVGRIVGSATPFINPEGKQRLGSLYVGKAWHGKGVGNQLMQRVVDWLDPDKPIHLTVATYNEKAKAFYKKWSFEEVPGSEKLFDEKIPEITMTRQPQNTQGETK